MDGFRFEGLKLKSLSLLVHNVKLCSLSLDDRKGGKFLERHKKLCNQLPSPLEKYEKKKKFFPHR